MTTLAPSQLDEIERELKVRKWKRGFSDPTFEQGRMSEHDLAHSAADAISQLRAEIAELKQKGLEAIPGNWCDPLLTGPNKVLPETNSYRPSDIECLLNAIRKRARSSMGMG